MFIPLQVWQSDGCLGGLDIVEYGIKYFNQKFGVPQKIINEWLLSNDFTIFENSNESTKNKQNFDDAEYTGRILRDDIKYDRDYTVVSEEMFEYICSSLHYECDYKIYR